MKLLHLILFRIAIATIVFFLLSCSTAGGRVVEHGFGFDIRRANPGVEIIDYRYGDSSFPVRAPEWAVKEGKKFYFNNVYGAMRVADILYVKWRIENSEKIYEEYVNLKSRMPSDLKGETVYLDIKESQLYVYLISKKRRPPEVRAVGPEMYRSLLVRQIFP